MAINQEWDSLVMVNPSILILALNDYFTKIIVNKNSDFDICPFILYYTFPLT